VVVDGGCCSFYLDNFCSGWGWVMNTKNGKFQQPVGYGPDFYKRNTERLTMGRRMITSRVLNALRTVVRTALSIPVLSAESRYG
jgi:hypothetical protein